MSTGNGITYTTPYAVDNGKITIRVDATLPLRKTLRLIQWLETGIITVSEFWQAQDPSKPVIKGRDSVNRTLSLVLMERFPKDRVLDRKAEKALREWMAEFATLAKAQYQSVEVFHDASNWRKHLLYSDTCRRRM